jgi:redox-sensitive bicupin YhaK (pirin superfamily)
MITVRPSEARGGADHGWLRTKHSFSFADYYDPKFMGFRSLRVINEDFIAPAKGFGTHGHRDMEIISYVVEGTLAHKDSMGNVAPIPAGDVQYMSAGSGVRHSEFNHDQEKWTHMLQIWIEPNEIGAQPRYAQSKISRQEKQGRWKLLASPNGAEGSIQIRQDAKFMATLVAQGGALSYELGAGRAAWIQLVRGEIEVEGQVLKAGDGASIEDLTQFSVRGLGAESEVLLFDLG